MKRSLGKVFMTLGIVLVLSSIALVAYNRYDDQKAGEEAKAIVSEIEEIIPNEPLGIIGEEKSDGENMMPAMEIDGDNYIGILQIPALELQLPVKSTWDYPKLKTSPCRYKGSAYDSNLIIAAHNFSNHFGNIKSLPQGSEIILTDADGNVFKYEVVSIENIDRYDIEGMESGEWDLTLFTCTVGGRERIALRCIEV